MREIKFRAWDAEEGAMHNWEDLRIEKDVDEIDISVVIFDGSTGGYYDDFNFLQYTGLKDKKGVEIYEGDVLHIDKRFNGTDIYGKVYWKGAGYALITRRGSDTSQGYFEIVSPYTKVIGNIFENPELLAGDKHGPTTQ